MRITPGIQDRNFLANINQTKGRLDKAQEEVSSGKRVNRLSDDPLAAAQTSELAASSNINDQFIANNEQLRGKLELTDATLQQFIRTIDNIQVLAVQALSGTTTAESRQALATALEGAKKQAVSDLSIQFNGTYLFSGTETSTEPFIESPPNSGTIVYQGNNDALLQRLDRSTVIQTNITGADLFADAPNSPSLFFAVLDDLKTAVENNDVTAIQTNLISVDSFSERINTVSAETGSHLQLVDQIHARLKNLNQAVQTQSSRLSDANLVESISNLNLATQAVDVSLNAKGRIQQLSLIDYLR